MIAIIILRSSFLKFFENADHDELDEELKQFIELETDTKIIKSEAYYWTKHGRIKGILTIADTFVMFDVLIWEENSKILSNSLSGTYYDHSSFCSKFQAWIDIQDIVSVKSIKLPNETSLYVKDDESRQCYLYDYYLQFTMSCVNARTLKKLIDSKYKDKKSIK